METPKKELTVNDVLTDVKKILEEICVPVKYNESIGMPIARAVSGIRMCIDAMNKAQEAEEKKEESNVIDIGEIKQDEK